MYVIDEDVIVEANEEEEQQARLLTAGQRPRTASNEPRTQIQTNQPPEEGEREVWVKQDTRQGSRNPASPKVGQGLHATTNPNENESDGSSQPEETPRLPASFELCSTDTEEHFVFRWYDIVLAFMGLFLYYVDLATDINLIGLYFSREQWVYGGVTLAIVFISFLVTVTFVYYIWVSSMKRLSPVRRYGLGIMLAIAGPILLPPIFVVFQLFYGWKSRSKTVSREERKKLVRRMKDGASGSVLYRLLHVYLQSAPQLLWQLYVLLVTKARVEHSVEGAFRVTAVLSSLVHLALTQAAFNDTDRNYVGNRKVITRPAQFFNFLWRAAQTGGRAVCIALFASAFHWWALAILLPHWFLMSLWTFKKLNPYDHRLPNRVLTGVANGYFSTFSHFVYATVRPSRFWHLALGAVLAVENMLMLGLWLHNTTDIDAWFHSWGFVVGLWHMPVQAVLQVLYFKCCHPSAGFIPICYTCDCSTWKRMLCEADWSRTELTYKGIFA